ncbi:hypothetical protein [Cupriavidus taiwanensis]|uniref:hypothetical protein n=1 Tax=Cupriavidus taiwanensis TaxID=164546 RepID=UPI000E101DC2|nr:hypothetical protein [Cupriavidus taiwanensis]SOY56809.1 conserved hypothetical protein [Cupriavidus taiwanensis]SOY90711.1 conserved hypothetical protein [Cupriavidus taiwanensis]SOZ63516.1 conserved hypothetical protein [Cupriavidus taiwanensis]SOZ82526.1 conserved hypothetical protein [Cupriavidus taiwanensis]SOZ84401.1 conserved hypothetical protein [Cupriavidus taiwanensis]
MTNTAIVAAPQAAPTQIITIDPATYVAAVYQPFYDKLSAAKAAADSAEFDITTTAGMEVAKKHRAVFRDEFRLAIEAARTERKAPILEIGRLIDSKAKEINAEVAPYEKRFDDAIKGEEQRKASEKAAKEAAERERVAGIRARIAKLQQLPVDCVGLDVEQIAAKLRAVEAAVIDDAFAEFKGEAELARDGVVEKLSAMHRAAVAAAEEAQRLAAERAELDRRQREEEERLAAERSAQDARLKAEREQQERELAEQRAKQAEADRIAREAREAEEARLAEQRAELQRQQDEINAARAEQERKEREAREAAEAEARAKREADEAAARAEAERIQAEKDAAEDERIRRERVQFELNGPEASEIVFVIAAHYMVDQETALNWMNRHVWADVEVAA